MKGAGCDVIRAERRSGATTAGRAESLLAFVPRSFHEFVRVTPTLHIKNCPHRMGKGGIMASTALPSPAEYREFAIECLRWADVAPQLYQRCTLIEIAGDWMHLALSIERNQAEDSRAGCRYTARLIVSENNL